MDRARVAAYWEANADTWTRHSRAGYDVYRDALNTPAFLSILPPVDGLEGLDIGCGEGTNTRKLAARGARMRAVDIAPTFIAHAQAQEAAAPLGIDFQIGDGMALPFADASFNFATSFMALMDMPDQHLAFREVARVLRPGGFFQFSILHPCFVPPQRRNIRDAEGQPCAVEVARYFDETDGEVETWWFGSVPAEERAKAAPFRVPRFHRTLSTWVDFIVEAGLIIEKFGEPRADIETAKAEPEVADTRVAPILLHVRVRKPVVA
jgi:SAM-dependent methyltransferase